jgi:rfaE bifunctional protein nucleotidyltransferase chain/domain
MNPPGTDKTTMGLIMRLPGGRRNREGRLATRTTHPDPADTLEAVGRLYSRAELVEQRAIWHMEGKSVVFTNGCFDLLHRGHVRLLEQARSMGDVLILGLNSDAGVERMKGPSRPILPERERAELAAELEAVDAVVLFDEETPRELIASLLPDVLVKGADWSHFIAGREEVEDAGGLVVTLDLEPGYSTTNLVDYLISQP